MKTKQKVNNFLRQNLGLRLELESLKSVDEDDLQEIVLCNYKANVQPENLLRFAISEILIGVSQRLAIASLVVNEIPSPRKFVNSILKGTNYWKEVWQQVIESLLETNPISETVDIDYCVPDLTVNEMVHIKNGSCLLLEKSNAELTLTDEFSYVDENVTKHVKVFLSKEGQTWIEVTGPSEFVRLPICKLPPDYEEIVNKRIANGIFPFQRYHQPLIIESKQPPLIRMSIVWYVDYSKKKESVGGFNFLLAKNLVTCSFTTEYVWLTSYVDENLFVYMPLLKGWVDFVNDKLPEFYKELYHAISKSQARIR